MIPRFIGSEIADTKAHAQNIQNMLQDLIDHTREDLNKIEEPRLQALLETSAEVLGALETAFDHYRRGTEKAWRR